MRPSSIIALVIVGVIALGIVGTALNIITIPWLKLNRQVQTNRDIVEKTYTAENALYNYRWFSERAGEIRATAKQSKIADEAVTEFEASAGPRSDWTFEDKTEAARLRAVAQGLRSHYESIVEEYNARATQADRAIFNGDLPLFFSLNPY